MRVLAPAVAASGCPHREAPDTYRREARYPRSRSPCRGGRRPGTSQPGWPGTEAKAPGTRRVPLLLVDEQHGEGEARAAAEASAVLFLVAVAHVGLDDSGRRATPLDCQTLAATWGGLMRRLLVLALAVALVALGACGGGSPQPTTSPAGIRSTVTQTTALPLPSALPDDIAFVRANHIWRVHADGSKPCQLTSGAGSDYAPAWSSDRSHIAFVHLANPDATSSSTLCVVPASGGPTSSWSFKTHLVALCYSPDGGRIAVAELRLSDAGPTETVGIFHIATGKTTIVRRLHDQFAVGLNVSWSPDGSRLLVGLERQDAEGQRVAVLRLASGKLTWLPIADAYAAHWSARGRSILVDQGDQAYTRISIADPNGGVRRVLLRGPGFMSGRPAVSYGCYSPHGSRVAYWRGSSIWTVGVDGHGAQRLIPRGGPPAWASR